jgi:hypothetical protein
MMMMIMIKRYSLTLHTNQINLLLLILTKKKYSFLLKFPQAPLIIENFNTNKAFFVYYLHVCYWINHQYIILSLS